MGVKKKENQRKSIRAFGRQEETALLRKRNEIEKKSESVKYGIQQRHLNTLCKDKSEAA